MDWGDAIDAIAGHVVRVTTPQGTGTGFLVGYSPDGAVCGIATAAHVVDHAHFWEQPIRIQHHESGKNVLLRPADRVILLEQAIDTAAVVFVKGELPLPVTPLPLILQSFRMNLGVELGWVGFPAISPANLCFFSGRASCWIEPERAYLVDGVAINGVSGGPTFHLEPEGIRLVGVVSAYMPNRATGEVLPGLCVVRDVKQFQDLVTKFKNMEQAKEKETIPAPPPSPAASETEPG